MKIYKETLEITGEQTIRLPRVERFLSVQFQKEILCVWALVNDSDSKLIYTLRIFGTGHEIPSFNLDYIGTVQDGPLVWHIFHQP